MGKTVFFITIILGGFAGSADAALQSRENLRVNDSLAVSWNPDGNYTLASSGDFKRQASPNDALVWNHLITSVQAPLYSLRPVGTITSTSIHAGGNETADDSDNTNQIPTGPISFKDNQEWQAHAQGNGLESVFAQGSAADSDLLLIGIANASDHASSSNDSTPSVFLNPNILQSPSLQEPAITDPFASFGRESVVPVPPAIWLFASALIGLSGMNSRRLQSK